MQVNDVIYWATQASTASINLFFYCEWMTKDSMQKHFI